MLYGMTGRKIRYERKSSPLYAPMQEVYSFCILAGIVRFTFDARFFVCQKKGLLTMNELMTVPELIEDYKKNEAQIRKMDMNNLSEKDMLIIKDYLSEKQFFSEMCDALDYTAASAVTITSLDTKTITTKDSIQSLEEKEEFARRLQVLSNDMDKSYLDTIYMESYGDSKTALERQKRTEEHITGLMESPEVQSAYKGVTVPVITVAILSTAAKQAEYLMEQNGIDKSDIHNSTIETVYDRHFAKATYTIDDDVERSKNKAKNLEIVESNDGYVMATNASSEEIKENANLQREYSEKVQNGNEVVHNEAPRETTIDLSEVGGHVKYEQFDDIGSVEKQQGIPDYETKEEMAVVAQKQATDNGKTKLETTKSSKHKSADMER